MPEWDNTRFKARPIDTNNTDQRLQYFNSEDLKIILEANKYLEKISNYQSLKKIVTYNKPAIRIFICSILADIVFIYFAIICSDGWKVVSTLGAIILTTSWLIVLLGEDSNVEFITERKFVEVKKTNVLDNYHWD